MFLTLPAFMPYARGALRVWKRRRVFRMTAHFWGRRRNCYTLAIRGLHRALRRSRTGNKERHDEVNKIYTTRLEAACEQLGVRRYVTMSGLDRSRVFLSKRSLSDLSIWEPRSFKAICHFGWKRAAEEGLNGVRDLGDVPKGVITRGMLKNSS